MTDTVRAPSRADLVKEEVRKRVTSLQRAYLQDEADAVAALAQLRRCAPDEPGADPTVWQVTIGGLPEALQGRRDISDAERAVHAALVLFAVHQQSNPVPMHQAKVGLGSAVQTLANARGHDGAPDQASIRRLHQVVLATDPSGRLYHLRGLITLLRSESTPIPLDYGQLAADLYRLFDPKHNSDSVVARWGRELHNRPRDTTTGENE
nr:type I-E CRISPR-associated protein Cse2/CasB [Propionicimonas sp.]